MSTDLYMGEEVTTDYDIQTVDRNIPKPAKFIGIAALSVSVVVNLVTSISIISDIFHASVPAGIIMIIFPIGFLALLPIYISLMAFTWFSRFQTIENNFEYWMKLLWMFVLCLILPVLAGYMARFVLLLIAAVIASAFH